MPFLQPFTYKEINLEDYLHSNRLQYVQGQDWKHSEAHSSSILGGKLHTVDLNSLKRRHRVIWQKKKQQQKTKQNTHTLILHSAWKLSSNKDWPTREYSRSKKSIHLKTTFPTVCCAKKSKCNFFLIEGSPK